MTCSITTYASSIHLGIPHLFGCRILHISVSLMCKPSAKNSLTLCTGGSHAGVKSGHQDYISITISYYYLANEKNKKIQQISCFTLRYDTIMFCTLCQNQ